MKCVNCDQVDVTGRAQRYPGIPMCEQCEREETVRRAAPELLLALQGLLAANDQIHPDVHWRRLVKGTPCDCRRCAEKQARLAIAKATGATWAEVGGAGRDAETTIIDLEARATILDDGPNPVYIRIHYSLHERGEGWIDHERVIKANDLRRAAALIAREYGGIAHEVLATIEANRTDNITDITYPRTAPAGAVAYDVDTPEGAATAHQADLLAFPYCPAGEY